MIVRSRTLPGFWQHYYAPPADIQKRASKQYALFERNPRYPSLQLKPLGSSGLCASPMHIERWLSATEAPLSGSGSVPTTTTSVCWRAERHPRRAALSDCIGPAVQLSSITFGAIAQDAVLFLAAQRLPRLLGSKGRLDLAGEIPEGNVPARWRGSVMLQARSQAVNGARWGCASKRRDLGTKPPANVVVLLQSHTPESHDDELAASISIRRSRLSQLSVSTAIDAGRNS